MISRSGKQDHAKDERPRIIVRKVKKHHGGHHGGAWKVAYADFVTAMMALFIVLWVLGASDKKFKAGIAHYFREPGVFSGSRGIIAGGGEANLGSGIIQSPSLEVLESFIKQQLSGSKELMNLKDQIPITLTPEGLLIEMIDKDKGAFFEVSSAKIKPIMRKVLEVIVKQVEKTPHKIAIGGHTDARPYHDDSFYSNWELSSARALNTRRALEEIGLVATRVEEVVGYADRKLRDATDPLSSENRRISILIKNPDRTEQKPSS
jgi:chemotaxis protein MotB